MNCELMLTYDTPAKSENRKQESEGSKNTSHNMAYLYEVCVQISDFCHQQLLRKMRRKLSWTDGRTEVKQYTPPPVERFFLSIRLCAVQVLIFSMYFNGIKISICFVLHCRYNFPDKLPSKGYHKNTVSDKQS